MTELPEWFVKEWSHTALRVEGIYRATARKGARHRSGPRDLWSFRGVIVGALRLRQGPWTADMGAGDQTLLLPHSPFTHEVLSDTCDLVAIDFRLIATGSGSDPLPSLGLPAVVRVPVSPSWLQALQSGIDAMRGGFDVFEGRGAIDRILGWHLKEGIATGAITVSTRTHPPPWLSVAHQNIMRAFWRQDASPGKMAVEAGFSRSHFCRAFKTAYGSTPMAFLWEHRLQIAARKLDTDPSLSVGSVAHNCGFKSHTHFTRMFRIRFGVTPLAWRRRRLEST